MMFKPVRHLSWTAKVFCIAIGYISSKDFLDEHHSFDEIEAVHRFGNHGYILALGWRKQAIALRTRPMSIKAILRQQPSTWPDRSMKERCFVEVRRRTRPMVCFVNVESVDRIIYSIFQRFNLEWKTRTLNLFTQAA